MDVADIPNVPEWLPTYLREQGIDSLYPPQAEAIECGVTQDENLVAAVPTASGKTLVATLAMLSAISGGPDDEQLPGEPADGGKALYIVPLRALASEKEAEFAEFEAYGLDVGVSTGNYESDGGWLAGKDVIVATSEKVDSLVRNDAPWLDDLSCVVADEVHLVDDGERGPTLEVTLAKLRSLNPALQLVALSATIGNAEELADWLDAALVDSTWRPIELKKGVHYGDALHLEDGSQKRVPVNSSEDQPAAVVRDTLEDDGSSLVFVNSRRNAEAAARRLTVTTGNFLTPEEEAELAGIADEIREVSDTDTSDDLADAVEHGAAFHHAGLCVTGDTQILKSDGTFEEIESLVSNGGRSVLGLSGYTLGETPITDTFEMTECPILEVETRTGNTLKLSETHPLPVLRPDGIFWKPAGEISTGDFVARPRYIDVDVETPGFRSLVPDQHRPYREYKTVKRLSKSVADSNLPAEYRHSYTTDRNISLGSFRELCDLNGEEPSELFEQAISDGGHSPINVPRELNRDLCWLIGTVVGDGYTDANSVVLTGRSTLLDEFCRICKEQFDREPHWNKSPSGTPSVTLSSKLVADVFQEQFGLSNGGKKSPRLPDIPLDDRSLGAYLSGLFDTDGSVCDRPNQNGSPAIELYSNSETFIKQVKTALLRFGIIAFKDTRDVKGRITEHDGRKIRTLSNVHRLTIYGTEQFRKFQEHIGFRHPNKSQKIENIIEKNPEGGRRQNDIIPSALGEHVREIRNEKEYSLAELEPEVPKATLSRFENGKTPMKRTTFQALATQLGDDQLLDIAFSDIFWDRIESVESVGSEPLYDLSTGTANFVADGIIAHNTSDHRSLVEDAFRDRLVKVVCATPTLAAGVNTPARRVIVRDWRRYDGTVGGMQPLSVLEVHQMMGRAGRPGLDPYGEAVLIAGGHDELDELFERYVWAEPEPVRSKLAAEPALRTHLLATVASGFARSREEVLSFLEGTLYAEQTADRDRLEAVTDDVIAYLDANGFLDTGDGLAATTLGHTVSRLYLDPMSAAEIIDGLEDAADSTSASDAEDADGGPTALGLYHLVCRTPDMYELYLRSGDEEEYTMLAYEREEELLGRAPSEFEDEFDDWLSALKTARLLEDWASEVDEGEITDRHGVGPGDIRGKVDTAQWLLGAAESLAGELDLGIGSEIREARVRVEHGVSEELVDLAGVRGVGRVRARRLFDAGIETRAELREADKSRVLAALRGREKTAETILENAGHRSPSMDEVEPDDDVSVEGNRSGSDTTESTDSREEASDDQANLGDF